MLRTWSDTLISSTTFTAIYIETGGAHLHTLFQDPSYAEMMIRVHMADIQDLRLGQNVGPKIAPITPFQLTQCALPCIEQDITKVWYLDDCGRHCEAT